MEVYVITVYLLPLSSTGAVVTSRRELWYTAACILMTNKKPHISISLSGTEGNAFAIVAKAHGILEEMGLQEEAHSLIADFTKLAHTPGSTYEHVKKIAEKYCRVTWRT